MVEIIKCNGILNDYKVIVEDTETARELVNNSAFGSRSNSGEIHFSLIEALFLIEKKKIDVKHRNKILNFEELLKKAKKLEPKLSVKYPIYRDLRNRGYIVKTALKFGADFRVYDRGVKPGDDHAKWIVYPVNENEVLTWHDFAAKTRVAHSTKKKLLMGIVDDENDTTYYEIKWIRP